MKKKPMTHDQASKKAFEMFPEGYIDVYFRRHRWCDGEIEDKCGIWNSVFEVHFTGPTYENAFLQIEEYILSKAEEEKENAS